MLSQGFHDVPLGCVAAVVTHLEMRAPPDPLPGPILGAGHAAGWKLARWHAPAPADYRALFARIGEDWLWFSRLGLDDAAMAAILAAPEVEVYALVVDGRREGLLELDFRNAPACDLAFLGVSAAVLGQGAGRFLMAHGLRIAWARPIARLCVHTCTLDHPGALAFYRTAGFDPVRREIEIAPDPRLTGVLPRHAAPQVPVLE